MDREEIKKALEDKQVFSQTSDAFEYDINEALETIKQKSKKKRSSVQNDTS